MTRPDGMVRALKALAVDDGSADSDRAQQAIRKLGGGGTPKDARDLLETLGESAGAPSHEEIDHALAVRRGERPGDQIRAHRTLASAGFRDADRIGGSEDRKTMADLHERMGTTRARDVHWERASLVFPQITREQAARRMAARGDADRGPPELPSRDMLSGPARAFRPTRGS